MKKVLAGLLVVVTLFTVVACAATTDPEGIIPAAPSEGNGEIPVGISPLLEDDRYVTEIDASELEKDEIAETEEETTPVEEEITTKEETTETQKETTEAKKETPTKKEPATTKKQTTTQKPSTTKKSTTTQKPATEVKVEQTTAQKVAIPTMAETTKKTTTTKKETATTKKETATTKKETTTKKPTTTTVAKPANPTYSYTTGQKHTVLSDTQRYHYNTLDNALKEVYNLVAEAVSRLDAQTEIFELDDEHEETFRKAYLAFHYDHPEYFYLARYFGVINYGNNRHRICFLYSVATYYEDPTGSNELFDEELSESLKNRIIAKKATFDKEVNRIIATIPANAPDVVKEKMAYETILKNCHYNLTAVTEYLWDGRCEDNWTAYGIMVNKKGVCESYAEAFQTLCLKMGINCMTISGSTTGGGHMWNAVELDDGWYMCDITFDDPVGASAGTARFNYFNRTSQWMQENSNHNWFMSEYKVPKCTKTKYSYENYFG